MRPPRDEAGIAHFVLLAVVLVLGAFLISAALDHPSARSGSNPNNVSIDADAISRAVNPSVVDITVQLAGTRGRVAGTGMILSSSGNVLTNNHVISGASSMSAQVAGAGHNYSATLVGYDSTDDIAVIHLDGAAGLAPAPIGEPATARVGDAVVALGNARGLGGAPQPEAGTITAFGQSVTATDSSGTDRETLSDMIQIAASVQPGDSGGPLVDAHGRVIGMNAAASTSADKESGSAISGFAIPIDRATTIATQMIAGRSSDTVHAGPRAILGITVKSVPLHPDGKAPGTVVGLVNADSGARAAGVQPDDVIVSVDGRPVATVTDLEGALYQHRPGDEVQLGWTDTAGHSRTASVRLVAGPPL